MWIIYYIMMAVALLLAAKRRKFRKYLRGNIDHKLQLSTLGANTLIGSNVADTVVDTTWCSSVRATWTLDLFTASTSDGPILCGIAHSDYSDAEIEEFVENITGSWDAGDLVSQEVARRKVRLVGVFDNPQDTTVAARIADGKMITTKAGWMLSPGDTIRIWAYNTGDGALQTTDPAMRTQGYANLWPKS